MIWTRNTSKEIADCRLPNADYKTSGAEKIGNRQLTIGITKNPNHRGCDGSGS
jgi:hypothetical protein